MDRKNFIRKTLLGTLGTTEVVSGLSCKGDKTAPGETNTEHCGATDSATAGPFYLRNTAEAVNLNSQNLPGTPMKVMGTVYDHETATPIPNGKIEIWHADDQGIFHPTGSGNVSDYEPNEVTLRGYVITNEEGDYQFNSIKPGLYTGRRRHIHYRIVASDYKALTTQSYWKGSNRIKIDRTDTNTEECRYVDFQDDGSGGIAGTFDIYLQKA
ncbi:MAG: hypothetical protein ACR2MX_00910 [Cyclobacteriaceae bacterium]